MADPSTSESATAQQPASPLFRLPAELRNRIYELALTSKNPLGARRDVTVEWEPYTTSSRVAQPALTRTCRAVRGEALPVFYAQNVFVAAFTRPEEERAMRLWLEAIGSRNREHLRQVVVKWNEYHGYFLELNQFRRARSRFLKRVKYEREVLIEGKVYYVVKLKCLTIDD